MGLVLRLGTTEPIFTRPHPLPQKGRSLQEKILSLCLPVISFPSSNRENKRERERNSEHWTLHLLGPFWHNIQEYESMWKRPISVSFLIRTTGKKYQSQAGSTMSRKQWKLAFTKIAGQVWVQVLISLMGPSAHILSDWVILIHATPINPVSEEFLFKIICAFSGLAERVKLFSSVSKIKDWSSTTKFLHFGGESKLFGNCLFFLQ